ncbi:DGC domain protein [Sporomusa ovata DSM 2662]|uniref:Conserved protein n=1 Tax=Sporomusa ovata TaxID=2378 RepID=A0A0U1KYX3_9FIRM|nr:putative zinc-binding protein [Sporomusa ovata]EQB28909.1 hypothetical protein SOV_1c06350 [Sporomusa ovata DSM 2662]CQR72339.1 Conserved protein [Sporomusa ovata]
MNEEKTVSRYVYPCAGAADVGEVTDQVCRKLRREGFAKTPMSCITGIAANLKPFIEAAQKMDELIVIDGCPTVCARKVMENAGISAKYYLLTEMGLEKGKTTITPELIEDICQRIKG